MSEKRQTRPTPARVWVVTIEEDGGPYPMLQCEQFSLAGVFSTRELAVAYAVKEYPEASLTWEHCEFGAGHSPDHDGCYRIALEEVDAEVPTNA